MALRLCDACSRHVRDTETSCPFCGETLAFAPIATATPPRLSRAARVAFVATILVGCREEPKPTADPTSSPPKVVADTAPIEVADTNVAAGPEDVAPPPAPSPTPSPSVAPKPPPKPTAIKKSNMYKPYGAPPAHDLYV